jgi:hypothetical protein
MRANAQPSGPALLIPADLRGTLGARRRARTILPLPRLPDEQHQCRRASAVRHAGERM